jgi:hypothetical protein
MPSTTGSLWKHTGRPVALLSGSITGGSWPGALIDQSAAKQPYKSSPIFAIVGFAQVWGTAAPGHDQTVVRTENRAAEWPVSSSLLTCRVNKLMALIRRILSLTASCKRKAALPLANDPFSRSYWATCDRFRSFNHVK